MYARILRPAKDLVSVFSYLGHGVVGHYSQWDICIQNKAEEHYSFMEAIT